MERCRVGLEPDDKMNARCQFALCDDDDECIKEVAVNTETWVFSIKPSESRDYEQVEVHGVPKIDKIPVTLGKLVGADKKEIGFVRLEKDKLGMFDLAVYATYDNTRCRHDEDGYNLGSMTYKCGQKDGVWYSRIGVRVPDFIAYKSVTDFQFLKFFIDEIECHCVTEEGRRIVFETLGYMLEKA